MPSKYDLIIEPEAGVEYGVLKGWTYASCIVFIKLPQSANIYGYRSKFHGFAKALNRRTGYHVVCAENHGDDISKKYDIEILNEVVSNVVKNTPAEYRFIGIDEGATYGLSHMCRQIGFTKMLLINMPISYELDQTVALLNGVDRRTLRFVYGEEDRSYRYTPLLKRLYADVITVKGADHNFTGMSSSFVDLQKMI